MITHIGKQLATQIVDTVHDVCGHDINFINKNGLIYASTNTSRIGSFQAADTGTVIEVQESEHYKGTSAGVNIPVTHNGYLIAVIGISGSPDEVRKYAYLAEKITRLLIREQELSAASRTLSEKRTYLLSYLLAGSRSFDAAEAFPDKMKDLNYIHDLLDEFEINIEKKKRVLIIRMLSDHSTITISSAEEKILRILLLQFLLWKKRFCKCSQIIQSGYICSSIRRNTLRLSMLPFRWNSFRHFIEPFQILFRLESGVQLTFLKSHPLMILPGLH